MASKILVDELAPQTGTDVTITATKKIAGANTQYKVTGGSSGQILTNDGSDGLSWSAANTTVKHSVFCEEQVSGTDGGTFTSGDWRIRTLNNEIFDDIGVTIATNVFTLPAGTFYIKWKCPAFGVQRHMSRLYDVDGAAVVEYGTSAYDQLSTANDVGSSVGWAKVTPGSPNQYRIEHRCEVTRATDGFGHSADFSVEKYTVVEVEQHA
jgi:hypothetical protein